MKRFFDRWVIKRQFLVTHILLPFHTETIYEEFFSEENYVFNVNRYVYVFLLNKRFFSIEVEGIVQEGNSSLSWTIET